MDATGYRAWYHHGVMHRARNRPALITSDGRREYWAYGEFVRAKEPHER